MAIDSGGYLYANNLRTLIATRLDASQRSRDNSQLGSVRKESVKRLDQSCGMDIRIYLCNCYQMIT